MLKGIKKYVYQKLHAYHLKKSDYFYEKIDELDVDTIEKYGDKAAEHTRKCLELNLKLIQLGES